jgi:hypothetical protein
MGIRHDSEVLLRQLDGHLAALRAGGPRGAALSSGTRHARRPDLATAERVADILRRLVADTNRACAADRARVRAAVHFFVSGRGRLGTQPARVSYGRRIARNPGADVRIVNDILGDLGTGLS